MDLEQFERFFGLALLTLVWSARFSINYPKTPLAVETRWDG